MRDDRPTAHVAYRAVLLAAALLVLGLLFRQLVTLLLAVLMTVIIAVPLAACAERLERRGVPRGLGALVGLLAGVGALALVIGLLIPPFVDETNEFADDVPRIVDELEHDAGDVINADPGEVGDAVQRFVERFTDDPERLVGPLTSIGLSVAGLAGALLLMLITAYFMAARPEPLVHGLLSLVPPARRDHVQHVLGRLRRAWIGWMLGVAVDMTLTGVLLYIGLSVIGVDFAVFFAVLAALLTLIPYFGATAAAIPPTLFALTDSPGKALLVLGIYLLVQNIESNITIPVVMAQTVRLHPAVIAIGVVVVGQLFGVAGLFVAVPILSLVVIAVDEFWVKPLERSHERRKTDEIELPSGAEPPSAQFHDGDDGADKDADHDRDLHPDPEAR
jgi:predicted PurR-regulated permease PerM